MDNTDGATELEPDRDDFIDSLVEKCLLFVDFLSGHPLRSYQVPLARRIIESLLLEDAAEITALACRQSGKSETLCNVIAAMLILLPRLARMFPERLGKFKDGLWVGCFAPTDTQADTLFGRIVDRLSSDRAQEILADPDIEDSVYAKSSDLRLRRSGSRVLKMTANPRAKIESKTFHLVVVDEAQDCDDYVVSKSIKPMMADTAGTTVLTGTPNTRKGFFYNSIAANKNHARSMRNVSPRHYEWDWKEVVKTNPRYQKHIDQMKEHPGEDSAEFQASYCVSGETRILTADLRHVRADEIKVGDKLTGFDEDRPGKGLHRRLAESTVEAVERLRLPCYRLTLDDGTSVTCSTDHQWLVTSSGATVWKRTDDLTERDGFFKVCDVWDHADTYETGYLAAAYDGEGCFSRGNLLAFSQRDNPMLVKVRRMLANLNFRTREMGGTGTNKDVTILNIAGGRAEVMRFLGQVRPERLLAKIDLPRMGTIGRHGREGYRQPRIVAKEFLGDQDVIAITTSSRTYIAEGLASHNCLKWMLDRGMLITEGRMEALGDVSMQSLVDSWQRTPVVVGIDVGKTVDSTVVTVVFVDWDQPDAFGYYNHRVLNWKELHGANYETQYYEIMRFLDPYNILAVGVDSNGTGAAVAERLSILLRKKGCDVYGMPMDQASQTKRWKHLMTLMDRGMIGWPAGAKVRRLKTWQRFHHQMTNAEKQFVGPQIKISAPNEAGAHDDYVDSLALAVSLTAEMSTPEVEVSAAPWY